jgi:hypothetical protein
VKKAMLDFSSLSVSDPSSAPNKGIYFYLSHAFFPFINIYEILRRKLVSNIRTEATFFFLSKEHISEILRKKLVSN